MTAKKGVLAVAKGPPTVIGAYLVHMLKAGVSK